MKHEPENVTKKIRFQNPNSPREAVMRTIKFFTILLVLALCATAFAQNVKPMKRWPICTSRTAPASSVTCPTA
jgi:hypothetical protein